MRRRPRRVEPGDLRSDSSQAAKVSGRWKPKTGRLRASGEPGDRKLWATRATRDTDQLHNSVRAIRPYSHCVRIWRELPGQ